MNSRNNEIKSRKSGGKIVSRNEEIKSRYDEIKIVITI